ncbi:hypothetical protein M569_10525, partial [Genlisea aurea]
RLETETRQTYQEILIKVKLSKQCHHTKNKKESPKNRELSRSQETENSEKNRIGSSSRIQKSKTDIKKTNPKNCRKQKKGKHTYRRSGKPQRRGNRR